MEATQIQTSVHIRWMISRDMVEVLDIERRTYTRPWQEDDFVYTLRQRNCIGLIAEVNDRVVGYSLYTMHKDYYTIINLVTDPKHQRKGYATAIINKIKDKLHERRRRCLLCVRERNMQIQYFLRAQGFLAKKVKPCYYEDTGEDAYLFIYDMRKPNDRNMVSKRG